MEDTEATAPRMYFVIEYTHPLDVVVTLYLVSHSHPHAGEPLEDDAFRPIW